MSKRSLEIQKIISVILIITCLILIGIGLYELSKPEGKNILTLVLSGLFGGISSYIYFEYVSGRLRNHNY